ncbi:ATP-binding protein [Bradyrhizobium sp. CIAT3101]|uniref:GAF domain-containing sensor histidine kinase n=1 Tax=Bradyrhizobium sp. CIAT3101 TaxID=439387 RepID=UPI0024B0CD9F|nr:ATP-binding protein [Bradyrhizobium sp. CIAT3101]WFU82426.1 ATP-binding protein [Bradyrhizobium sp. CIAT3101]
MDQLATSEASEGAHGRSDLQKELEEVLRQRAAISAVLRAIANSLHDLQPIFDTIIESAVHLCRAEWGAFRLVEEIGFRLVAYKASPELSEVYSPPLLREHSSVSGRLFGCSSPVHIPDLATYLERMGATDEGDREAISSGARTVLFVPMLRNDELIGTLNLVRYRIEPFTEKVIELVTDFAAQAAIAVDITRREQALRDSERRSRSAIDGIPGLVAILAPNGDVEAVNRQILEYYGLPLEEMRNWGTNEMLHHEDRPHLIEIFTKSIASGVPYQHQVRLRRFDGEYRWFDSRGVPIRDDSGRITRWYVLLTDIEDRTQALARLQQMQSDFAHINRVTVMGELAASLSHEIAQPIASARNNARAAQNFLNMQPLDLGEVREALACIVGDTDRARDIIDRIREQMKNAPPRKERFDLSAAINELIVLARSVTNRNGVSVQTQLADGLFPVEGDRVQLQQVLLNLILNAAEAMGSVEVGARELLISTEQDRTGVRVAVRDSGPGIDPAHLERVFDAFYTTKSSGTGMGLSICRSIITAHGGRLWADANEPRGAVFQFTLPNASG